MALEVDDPIWPAVNPSSLGAQGGVGEGSPPLWDWWIGDWDWGWEGLVAPSTRPEAQGLGGF